MRNVRKAVLFTVMTLILMACEKHVQPERTDGSVTVEETVERTVEFEIPEMTAPDVPISASSRAGESVSVELNDQRENDPKRTLSAHQRERIDGTMVAAIRQFNPKADAQDLFFCFADPK